MNTFQPSYKFPSGLSRLLPAVELGSPAAMWRLGLLYATGNDVAQDSALAEKYLGQAAAAGYAIAQRDLALHLSECCHGAPQYERAAELFAAAAAQGCSRSQLELGTLYLYGRGVPQDLTKARELFALAAAHDSPTATALLYYLNVTDKVPPANPLGAWGLVHDLAKGGNGDAAVTYWFLRAAKYGWVNGDLDEAIRILQSAAEQGHPAAMRELGKHILGTQPTAEGEKDALGWLLRAAKAGDPRAQFVTAECFESGRGTPLCSEQADHWYRKSAQAGYVRAEFELAKRSLDAANSPESRAAAMQLLMNFRTRGYNFAVQHLADFILAEHSTAPFTDLELRLIEDAAPYYTVAALCLADIYLGRDERSQKQRLNKVLGAFWLQMEVYDSNPYCLYLLGRDLVDGTQLEQNLTEGLALLHCAAEAGYADAAAKIAYVFNFHPKLIRNPRYAAAANEAAAKKGSTWGQGNFALSLTDGRGIEVNEPAAQYWRNRRAEAEALQGPAIVEAPFSGPTNRQAKVLSFDSQLSKKRSTRS